MLTKDLTLEQVQNLLQKFESRELVKKETKNGEEIWASTEKGYELIGEIIRQKLKNIGLKPTPKLDEMIVRAMKGDRNDLAKLLEILL